jgi:modulator of FtsH protease
VTAYDVASWSDFAGTVADVAAALAGLLFVGLSMNLREVLAFPALPARAAATLGLLIAILLAGVFLATPGQGGRVLGIELAAVGILMAVGTVWAALRQKAGQRSSRTLYSLLLLGIPALLMITCGISLWLGRGGGLYWLTAAVVSGFVSTAANAWVLLVEIKR